MVLTALRLGQVELNFTFIIQIVNTFILVLMIYFIYKIIKKVLSGKSKLETRVSNLEDELKKIKDNEVQ